MDKKIKLRPWQKDAVKTIAQALQVPHSLVAVNACVGSGKTFVPFEAIVNFIKQHKNEKTFHTFVCPRIKLCTQQAKEAEKLFEDRGLKVSVKIWNSDSDDVGQRYVNGNEFWDSKDKNILCVICDESLWGISVLKIVSSGNFAFILLITSRFTVRRLSSIVKTIPISCKLRLLVFFTRFTVERTSATPSRL